MQKTIAITCRTGSLKPINEIENFQGQLKDITEQEMGKLKKSILKYGFSFPIFIWQNKILDGHQRLEAIKQLIFDGYKIKGDKLPIVNIEAEDEAQAAEKLLLINSRYAKITQGGFDVFVADFDIDLDDMSIYLDIPDVIIDYANSTDPNDEWDGMPDFRNDGLDAYHTIKVHFNDQAGLDHFSKLIKQKITKDTKYIFHPKQVKENLKDIECGE